MALSLSPQQKQDFEETATEFIRKYAEDAVVEYAKAPNDVKAFTVDWEDLYLHDHKFAEDLLDHPELMQAFEHAVANYDLPVSPPVDPEVRLANLGDELVRQVHEVREDVRGEIIAVSGQIEQKTGHCLKLTAAAYVCQRCGVTTVVGAEEGDNVDEPTECRSCERQGPFEVDDDAEETTYTDYRMVRLQAPPELASEASGESIDVLLHGDLVDEAVDPGKRVEIVGELITVAKETSGDKQLFEVQLRALGVNPKDDGYDGADPRDSLEDIKALAQRDDLFEVLTGSLAPTIVGDDHLRKVKLAMLLATFGAGDGFGGRGVPHILILGDPGVGKSRMLTHLSEVAPRSEFASGESSTAAGLTASAERDDFGPGEWKIKSGALPRANGGILCLDEIDKASEKTREALHTPLAKQTVEKNTAGPSATLPARTSLIAAGNPKYGRFGEHEAVGDQIELSSTLMTRFDLMFMMKDEPDEDTDGRIADHVLTSFDPDEKAAPVEEDLLTAYIAYARENVHPTLTDEAKELLKTEYVEIRDSTDDDGPIPITARVLDGLARLTLASARARLADRATQEDASRAVTLVKTYLNDVGMDSDGEWDADIVETGTPMAQRKRLEKIKMIIDDLAGEIGAAEEDIIGVATSDDLDADTVRDELKNLRKKGEIYEPETGSYRTSN